MQKTRTGLGTWQFGGPNYQNGKPTGWGYIDEADAMRAVWAALNVGVAFFDTADTYGAGQAERLLGRALAEAGVDAANVTICSKFGNTLTAEGQPVQDFSAEYVARSVEASLQRLGRDTIDILLLHSPPDDFDWTNYDPAPYEALVRSGKIRAYGVSSKSVYGAKRVLEAGFGSVLEVIYNALDRRAEDVLFCDDRAANYQFIARVPLASGFLNAKYLRETPAFAPDQYRHLLPDRDRDWLLTSARALAFLDELPGGLATSALRFCLSNPAVSVVIPGARNEQQVRANAYAETLGPLSADLLSRIREAVPDVPEHWKPKVV